jgi:hypothetical protein
MKYSREYIESLRRKVTQDDLKDVRRRLAQIDAHEEEWRIAQERMRRSLARIHAALERRRALITRLSKQ